MAKRTTGPQERSGAIQIVAERIRQVQELDRSYESDVGKEIILLHLARNRLVDSQIVLEQNTTQSLNINAVVKELVQAGALIAAAIDAIQAPEHIEGEENE